MFIDPANLSNISASYDNWGHDSEFNKLKSMYTTTGTDSAQKMMIKKRSSIMQDDDSPTPPEVEMGMNNIKVAGSIFALVKYQEYDDATVLK